MAGDWLKIQVATPDKPEIWAVAADLEIDPDAVFGKLFRMWAWFDQHTESGNAPCVTKTLIDRHVGVNGFCDAVIRAGWMNEADKYIQLPNFTRHNGQTAKNRALTAKRVANHKVKQNTAGNATRNNLVTQKALPREDTDKRCKHDVEDSTLAEFMWARIDGLNLGAKKPNLQKWANAIRVIREQDKHTIQEIRKVFIWANASEFWKSNIRSPDKLREKWPTLLGQMTRKPNAANFDQTIVDDISEKDFYSGTL